MIDVSRRLGLEPEGDVETVNYTREPSLPMNRVNNFNKTYNNFVAVRNLTFSVKPGEILGLVGPNGAGKTTLMRVLSGILPPGSGTLSVAGHDIITDPVNAKHAI
jgi:ABC-2 type transport system ATP-binding protein